MPDEPKPPAKPKPDTTKPEEGQTPWGPGKRDPTGAPAE